FGSGAQIGTGNFVVYKGTGTQVAVTGLSAATTYHVEVFEFNAGTTANTQNFTESGAIGSQATEAPVVDYVLIAEVYGGGGNSGAYWKHDYIVLYNPTNAPISLDGYSVQYASAAGTSWQ